MGDEMDTKPTIETVLERLDAFREAVEVRFDRIEDEVTALRKEMNAGFHKVDRKFEILSGDILKLRGDIGLLEDSLDKLETKPS